MIAALPMYDWPETRVINDVLWAKFSAKLIAANCDAPQFLTRSDDLMKLWLSPDLLIAQTCSYPLETVLKNKVQYVATPSYSVVGCEKPGHYRSVIVMRRNGRQVSVPVPEDNTATLPGWPEPFRFAFNGVDSMSGYHAVKRDLAKVLRSLPTQQVQTGSHRASIIAVANGQAEFCSVDCVSWAMAQIYEPATEHLYVAGWTSQRPGLPLITALHTDHKTMSILADAARSVLDAVVLSRPTDW